MIVTTRGEGTQYETLSCCVLFSQNITVFPSETNSPSQNVDIAQMEKRCHRASWVQGRFSDTCSLITEEDLSRKMSQKLSQDSPREMRKRDLEWSRVVTQNTVLRFVK